MKNSVLLIVIAVCSLSNLSASDCPISDAMSAVLEEYDSGGKGTRALQKYIESHIDLHKTSVIIFTRFMKEDYCPSSMRSSLTKSTNAAKKTVAALAKLRKKASMEKMTKKDYGRLLSEAREESRSGSNLWSSSLASILDRIPGFGRPKKPGTPDLPIPPPIDKPKNDCSKAGVETSADCARGLEMLESCLLATPSETEAGRTTCNMAGVQQQILCMLSNANNSLYVEQPGTQEASARQLCEEEGDLPDGNHQQFQTPFGN